MSSVMQGDLDLSTEQLSEVCRILFAYVPDIPVWAFGSRVTGTAREYSDLDLALITQEPLPLTVKADLVHSFEESSLPFKVDLVDWSSVSTSFQEIIMKKKVVLHEGRV